MFLPCKLRKRDNGMEPPALYQPNLNQCSTFIPPEDIRTSENRRFSNVFRGYKSATLVVSGLQRLFSCRAHAPRDDNQVVF